MNKLLLFILMFCGMATTSFAQQQQSLLKVNFTTELIRRTSIGVQRPRTPVQAPDAALDGHSLFIYSDHEDYTLQLKDGDEVVYETVVPAGVSSVELPSSYSGSYELHLHTTVFCFAGDVTL